jgi:thiosulfate/3-mercaptopyruvate sulfurtransferase
MKTLPIAAALALALGGAAHAERLTEAPLVDAAWLTETLGNESLVVIDVRDPATETVPFTEGYIPGAVAAPYTAHGWRAESDGIPGMLPPVEDIAAKIGALGVDGADHVVIVSQGTDSSEFGRATRVYWTFKVLGHDAVSILDGGKDAWLAAGGATEAAPATPEAATFEASLRPELLADAEAVAAAIESDVALVDGRPVEQYKGEAKSDVARVAGTIPTSVNIPHGAVYDGAFATPEEVLALAAAAGVPAEGPAIAFCNTGHWASIAWFALSEVAEIPDVSMYDGSMADWTRDETRPVVNGVIN